MNSLTVIEDLKFCPRCGDSAETFLVLKTENKEASSSERVIKSVVRDIVCLGCGLQIHQVLSTGENLTEQNLESPSRFGT